jgi:hypothetical protein
MCHDFARFNDPFFIATQPDQFSRTNHTETESAVVVVSESLKHAIGEIIGREVAISCTL